MLINRPHQGQAYRPEDVKILRCMCLPLFLLEAGCDAACRQKNHKCSHFPLFRFLCGQRSPIKPPGNTNVDANHFHTLHFGCLLLALIMRSSHSSGAQFAPLLSHSLEQ